MCSEHYTINYIDASGQKVLRAKKGYNTEREAQCVCFKINLRPESIHKAVIYKCSKCNKWHIGHHSGKLLDSEEKKKIENQYKKWKILNNYENSRQLGKY